MSDEPQNQVTELEDEQLGTQIDELNKKEDRNEEETNKLTELKKERGGRYQKRIDQLSYQKKTAEEQAESERKRYEEILAENERLKTAQPEPVVSNETITIRGKQYYSDSSLRSMIDGNKISETEALDMQQKRNKAEAAQEAYSWFKQDQEENQKKQQAASDAQKVLAKHPEWDAKHPNHNPKDPMMVEVIDLYNSGMSLAKAMDKAERYLGKTHIDNTENLNLHSPSAPNNQRETEVKLSDDEKDIALRTWRNIKNPKTDRLYTESEAIEKAKNAKAKRR